MIVYSFTNNYKEELQYILHMFECSLMDNKTEYVLEEVLLFENKETNIETFGLIQEKFTEKVKEGFKTLIENIAKLWARFLEAVNKFVKSDKDYLQKYKTVILNKPLKEESYTMYPYWKGYQLLLNSKVPAFNFSTLKDDLEDKDAFISKHFNRFRPSDKNETYIQVATSMFKGSNKPVVCKAESINMTDLYNFCLDYDSNVAKLERDIKEIDKAGRSAIDMIDRNKPIGEHYYTLEKYFYSVINESIIYEEELVKKASSDQKTTTSSDSTRQKSEVKNVDGENKSMDEDDEKSIQDRNVDIDRVKLYMTTCTEFLGCKMSVLQETYKAYMFIIRDHIKSHVGTEKKTDNVEAKNATDNSVKDDKNTSNKGKVESIIDKAKALASKVTGKNKATNESFINDEIIQEALFGKKNSKSDEEKQYEYYKFLTETGISEKDFESKHKRMVIADYKKLLSSMKPLENQEVVQLPPKDVMGEIINSIDDLYGKDSVYKNHPEYGIISMSVCYTNYRNEDNIQSAIKARLGNRSELYNIVIGAKDSDDDVEAKIVLKDYIVSDFVYRELETLKRKYENKE